MLNLSRLSLRLLIVILFVFCGFLSLLDDFVEVPQSPASEPDTSRASHIGCLDEVELRASLDNECDHTIFDDKLMYRIVGRVFIKTAPVADCPAAYLRENTEVLEAVILYDLPEERHKGEVFKLHPLIDDDVLFRRHTIRV